MVYRVESPLEDGAGILDWYNFQTKQIQRTSSQGLPEGFGDVEFFAGLRDVQILKLAPAHIVAIGQSFGGEGQGETHLTLERDGTWMYAESNRVVSVAAPTVQRVLDTVGDLKAQRVEALVAESLDKFGLKAPACSLRLTLSNSDASPVRVLLIGAEVSAEGERYAMVKGQDSVFVLSEGDVRAFMTPLR